jgi:hypothetical protein
MRLGTFRASPNIRQDVKAFSQKEPDDCLTTDGSALRSQLPNVLGDRNASQQVNEDQDYDHLRRERVLVPRANLGSTDTF